MEQLQPKAPVEKVCIFKFTHILEVLYNNKMIGNYSVQLYPYTKLSKLEFEKTLELLKRMNVNSIELTSELLKKYGHNVFQSFFVRHI